MKSVTTFTQNAWESGDYVDDQRAVVRATIQKVHQHRYEYHQTEFQDWKHEGRLATMLFNQDGPIREIPGIESFKWQRGLDQDAGTATMVIANVNWLKDAPSPSAEEFDFPGWYTPNRGIDDFFDDWNYDRNSWANWLIPDRLIRTYEGYGTDGNEDPAEDVRMYPSGVWLVDDVSLGTDGRLTIEMRDLGRIFLDDNIYLGVIPNDIYPLYFEQSREAPEPDHYEPASWAVPDYIDDSNSTYAADVTLENTQIDTGDGSVHTHLGSHAVDSNTNTFWLSVGSDDPGAFEWIQLDTHGDDVAAIQINPKGGSYKVYVSVHTAAGWRGVATVPFQQADDGPEMPGADLPYVRAARVQKGITTSIRLPKVYTGVDKIRLTFQSHWDSGIGKYRHYRVGIQEVKYATAVSLVAGSGTYTAGNYNDYSDIIKWLAGWTGWYWPHDAVEHRVDGTRPHNDGPVNGTDWTLPKGGIYGDVREAFVQGIVKLDHEVWDKQTIADGIGVVRDIIGFALWVNEMGGLMWRLPNWFNKGNYIQPTSGGGTSTHTTSVLTIDEAQTLVDMSVKLSSRNIRERIFVSNPNGRYGFTVRGYNPAPIGLRRTSGWTDQHFKSRAECRRMAYLIAIRQFYKYRQNTLTIAANPAIQVDDQVIIKERLTGEGYLHHIEAISSDWSAEDGRWTYTLTTNWLGDQNFTRMGWKPQHLDGDTKAYLEQLGVDFGD